MQISETELKIDLSHVSSFSIVCFICTDFTEPKLVDLGSNLIHTLVITITKIIKISAPCIMPHVQQNWAQFIRVIYGTLSTTLRCEKRECSNIV